MYYIIEIMIALIISYLFIKQEKPKIKYLFLGYGFFLLSLILQLPFKYLETQISLFLENSIFPLIILGVSTIIISELTKYFSLKRFMKTKSYKNGILFGIGWSSIESINFITSGFYSIIFSVLSVKFNFIPIFNENLSILSFIVFFTFNVALTVLTVISIIKKNVYYLLYSIFLSISIFIIPNLIPRTDYKLVSLLIFFLYSITIIFRYKKLK